MSSSPTAFTILITDNQSVPIQRGNLKGLAYNVRFSTMLPGGCANFSCNVPGDYFSLTDHPEYISFNYKIQVLSGGIVVWSGRLEDASLSRDRSGWKWTISGKGFAANLDDQQYTSQDVSGLTTDAIVSNVISSLTQQIDASSITGTGFTLSGAAAINLKMLSSAQILSWAAMFGNSTYTDMIWYVYPDDDGTVRITFKPRPLVHDLLVTTRSFSHIGFKLMGRGIANRILMQYNGGGSTVAVNDTDLQGAGPIGYNVIRTARFFLPEISQSADASQAAQTLLNLMKEPRMSTDSFQCGADVLFRDAYGQEVPLHLVRAGQFLRFEDVIHNESWCIEALIVETDYDEAARTLTVKPETFDNVMERVVAKAVEILNGRHTVYAP